MKRFGYLILALLFTAVLTGCNVSGNLGVSPGITNYATPNVTTSPTGYYTPGVTNNLSSPNTGVNSGGMGTG